jgi:MotA/TolQ/ExbB proton channel family
VGWSGILCIAGLQEQHGSGAMDPFVGSFGTVLSIINAFRGSSATKAMLLAATAGGNSQALVTTGLGLLVAVPSVRGYNDFSNELELFAMQMNNSVEDISAYLKEFQDVIPGNRRQTPTGTETPDSLWRSAVRFAEVESVARNFEVRLR